MGKSINHEEYLNQLKDLNILCVPQEKYNGSLNKILHKCICGNEWFINPIVVLSKPNITCGCSKKFNSRMNNRDTYKDNKTILYYVKVENIYKIGITLYKESIKNSIKNRFRRDIKNNIKIEINFTEIFEKGEIAWDKEQQILKKYKKYQYLGEKILVTGNAELFKEDILKEGL